MVKAPLCLFNFAEIFHPFFVHAANEWEKRGRECWFFNLWPGEILGLKQAGKEDRLVSWKEGFRRDRSNGDPDTIARLAKFDPYYQSQSAELQAILLPRMVESARQLVPLFREILERHQFGGVCFWNGFRFPDPIFRMVCEEAGVKTIFLENGFFSHTMQIDPDGINAGSTLAKRSATEWRGCSPANQPRFDAFMEAGGNLPPTGTPLNVPAPLPRAKRIQSLLSSTLLERSVYTRLPRRGLWEAQRDKSAIAKAKQALPSTAGAALPAKYLFLAFQVHDDTQILINSPWVNSMEQFYTTTLKARDELALPHHLVIKEHPVDVGRYDYTKLEKPAHVTWLREYPLPKTIDGSDCVLNVNSSVGIEAIVRGKPVVTLGDAFYNVPGIVEHAKSEAELAGAISRALEIGPDWEFRREFLCRLRFEDMVEASWSKPTDAGVLNAVSRIDQLLT